MNYTLQLHGERMLYPTPSGLYEMMNDIAREVLRDQPSLLYEYIAHYLDTLVRVREYARMADSLVSDVVGENTELLAYVHSLGVSWEEANLAARKIQAAFRVHKARRNLRRTLIQREERVRKREEMLESDSFVGYLEKLGLDSATIGDVQLDEAIEAYLSRQETKSMVNKSAIVSKDVSTHTIDEIALRAPLKTRLPGKKVAAKRDSKLLVYKQSPKASYESTWSTMKRDLEDKERKLQMPLKTEYRAKRVVSPKGSKALVYDQPPKSPVEPNLSTSEREVDEKEKNPSFRLVYKGGVDDVSSKSMMSLPLDTHLLPSYYDENQRKIPMISESGLLIRSESVEEAEIVTLFSADGTEEELRASHDSDIRVKSLANPVSGQNNTLAQDLLDIIDPATSQRFIPTRKTSRDNDADYSEVMDGLSQSLTDEKDNTGSGISVKKGSKQSFHGTASKITFVETSASESGVEKQAGSIRPRTSLRSKTSKTSKGSAHFIDGNKEPEKQ